jgi:hypothetical protein
VADAVDHHDRSMDGGIDGRDTSSLTEKKKKPLRRFENAYAVVFPNVHF